MENLKIILKEDFDNDLDHKWAELEKNSNCSIFQFLDWQKNWKKEISDNDYKSKVLFFEIYYKEKLICIVPFQIISKFSLKILKISGKPFNDYSDIILDKNYLDLLKKNNKFLFDKISSKISVDLMYFENIPEKSDLNYLLNNYQLKSHDYSSYQLINIRGQNSISNKFINDTFRQIKRLSILGKLEFKILNDLEEKKKLINFFLINKEKQLIETNSWNYLKNINYRNFLEKTFLSKFNSQISALYLNKKLIAGHIGLINFYKFFYLFPTYDKNFYKYSPGNIVLYYLINNFFEKNGKVFDLTTGDENYKIRLSNNKTKILFFCKSFTLKGLITKLIIIILNSLKHNKKLYFIKKFIIRK